MNKSVVSRCLLWSTVLIFAFFLTACQEEKKPAPPAQVPAPESRPAAKESEPQTGAPNQSAPVPEGQPLELLRFGPSGEVRKISQLAAMFNQPMVALGDYRNVPEEVLTFDPPLKGDILWLNQYTLTFVPDEPLIGSLEFTARLNPEKLQALSGARLEEGREITVKLPELGVSHSYQLNSSPSDEDQALRPSWRVFFNQPLDEESLKAKTFFIWSDGGREQSLPVLVQTRPDGQNREFTLSAAEKLPRNTAYRLIVEEGVKSLAGPKPGPRLDLAQSSTYGPFSVNLQTYSQKTLDPESGFYLNFSNRVRLSEIVPLIKVDNGYDLEPLRRFYAKPAPAEPAEGGEAVRPADEEVENVDDLRDYLYLPGGLRADTAYTLTIDASAKDIFGQSLGSDYVKTFTTGQYQPYLSLSEGFGLLEKDSRPWLNLIASNMKEARLEAYSLNVDQAIEFLAAARFSPEYYGDVRQAEKTLKDLKPEVLTLPVPNGAVDGRTRLKVDLEAIFGEERLGHFLYLRTAWKRPGQKAAEPARHTYAMALISDIGLAIKVGPESSLIWTTDLVKGRSWPRVELELRDSRNKVLWSGRSDENGLARLPGTAEIMPKVKDRNLFVVARAEGQLSLWNANWTEGLETWRWNVNTGEALSPAKSYSNWLLNALPLYKPGETAKFKVIARRQNGDDLKDQGQQEVDLEIVDGRGETVEKATVKTNALGTFSYELGIPPEAALGYWTVKVGLDGSGVTESIGSFMVMNYRAPAFEIKFEDLPKEALSGQEVDIKLKADYHFGAPVSGQPFKYSVSSSPAWFSLPGNFSHYSVTNRFKVADENDDRGERYSEPSLSVASDQGILDNDGRLNIKLNLTPAPEQLPQPRTFTTFVTVDDVDQRQVSTNAGLLVHPAELYAGFHSDNFVTEAGQPYALKLIAADRAGGLVAGRKVTATLYKRTWQNVRRKSAGTAYEYVSKMVDSKIESRDLVSGEMPLELNLTPPEAGYYWVLAEIKDDQGRVNQASYDFYAFGGGPVGWSMNNDDQVALVTDKKEYRPGETARIMVQSPFDRGQGLMTVERSGVIRSEVFDIVNQTPVLEVPITEEDSPNIFISVLLSRGRIADKLDERGLDFGKPAIRLGYAELKIPTKKNLLTVEVTPDQKEVGPGGEVEVTVKVSDHEGRPVSQAEVALIAADAAVLQLGGEAAYYPQQLYHRDQPLRVQTADNLISLIGRQDWGSKGDNPGGGGAMKAMAAPDSAGADGVRRLFASLAWFEPQLALDKNGQAKIKMKMPENLTTFKIYAVATGSGRLTGTGQSSVLVSRDLLVRSALPGYAGVGDEFKAAMVLTNRGQKSGQARVRLSGENFTLLDDQTEKTIEVKPNENQELTFRVKAGPEPQAKFLFEVIMGEESDKVEYSLPVSPANKLTTQASYERLTEGRLRTGLAVTKGLDPNRGGLELQLAPSLIGVLDEPFNWLVAYPHGCVEQATSKAYGNLVWLNLKDRLKGTEKQAQEARANVEASLERLLRWEQGGGFNYWPDDYDWSRRSVYLSAYVLDFLLSAREAGFKLPDPGLIERINGFLKNALNSESRAFPAWYSENAVREAKSYVLAMLSRSGENVAAYIELEYKKREELSLFELINLIRAVGFSPEGSVRSERLKALLPLLDKHILLTAGEVQFVDAAPGAPEIWSSSVRTSAMTMSALCETAPGYDLLPGLMRWLVSASRSGHFGSTQNNATALAALGQYVKVMEPGNPDLAVMAKLGENSLAEVHFKSYLDPAVEAAAPLGSIPAESPAVIYEVSGQGQAWAALKLKSAPLTPDLSADGSGGFMLSRAFTVLSPEKGAPGADRFRRGDLVRVSVTMMVPAPRHNVVLEDRVPAGFEPINFNLADADLTLLDQVEEDRPDGASHRRRYWYDHQEIWPDRVAVYADHLDAGVYTYSYLARAITSGAYLTPGPQAEEMYAPETFGRGSGQLLTVE